MVCARPLKLLPPPRSSDPQLSEVGGRGHRVGGKRGGLQGGRGEGGRGKGKGTIVSETCGHLGGQVENEKNTCSAEWPRFANG